MKYESFINVIEEKKEEIFGVSDAIWGYAETAFNEFRSSAYLSEALEKNGFSVERNVAGIPTAFKASYGSGKPVIGIQAEFDALDGLSQEANITEEKPVEGITTGHGCGHNLFSGGSFAAALAVKKYIDETGRGKVVFFGCPAEENGGGKVFMVRDGAYDGIDSVVSWHPEKMYMVRTRPSLANVLVDYSFTGIASHAGGSPEKGRSALDAAELMNMGAQFLREHMDLTCRIHYAFIDVGGKMPNVVQAHATVRYLIRANDNKAVLELKERVDNLARGAAIMTDTKYTATTLKAYSNLITIPTLQATANEAMHDVPLPVPTEDDIRFARELQKTMRLTDEQMAEEPYAMKVLDPAPPKNHGGSTDTADVSWVTPTVQMHIGNWVIGTAGHSWQVVAQGKSRYAKESMLYAGKALAGTVMRLMDDPALVEKAKAEHKAKTGGKYVCPLPKDAEPRVF